MKQRNVYLNTLKLDEAISVFDEALKEMSAIKNESIPVIGSLGRVTSRAVFAKLCSPLNNCAAMDGIAVMAAETATASKTAPLALRLGNDCIAINTGDVLPATCDAVIMIEDVIETNEPNVFHITAAAAPWQHVRPVGEDIVAGEMIIPGRHLIRPVDIGALLAGGVSEIEVVGLPRVSIIPTGSEIVEPGAEPKLGEIIESNSRMLEALVTQRGGLATRFAPVPDRPALLKEAFIEAVEQSDIILINAGSSAGSADYTPEILSDIGRVVVHGVAIRPGKPTILAVVSGKPVIGVPGYPVSAYLAFELFAAPLIDRLSLKSPPTVKTSSAVVTRRIVSSLNSREYVRVKLGIVGERLVAAPLSRGAGAAMSLVRSDGFLIVDQDSEGVEAGQQVPVVLERSMSQIEATLVSIGSHDLILDIISDLMPNFLPGSSLSSTHAGSMGGLMALSRGETVLAPIHLLDEQSGLYNIPWIKKLFKESSMALIRGVGRVQGIMVKPGNPLNITTVRELTKARFVNRQRGAGTRLLLDYLMKKYNIKPGQIDGYEREATTHTAVAAAVASGSADAGMGVFSAARSLGLDFIPVGDEQYDFAIKCDDLELEHVKAFLAVLKSHDFKTKLSEMGGYTFSGAGEIVNI
jgi:putative molybdopterin biosynthesis protein